MVHRDTVYVSRHFDIFAYHVSKDEWNQLPASAYQSFCMAVLENQLTTIGGISRDQKRTNCLYSLVGRTNKEWDDIYPPIPTHRVCAATLTTPTHLIVAGGRDKGELNTIEVLSKETYQWSQAINLPEPMGDLQTVLGSGRIFICMQQAFYSHSLEKLLESCYQSAGASAKEGWSKMADIPTFSGHSLCCLGDQVLAVGGCDDDDKETMAIHGYDSDNAKWNERGEMPIARNDALVASVVLGVEEMVVVIGGWSNADSCTVTQIGTLEN